MDSEFVGPKRPRGNPQLQNKDNLPSYIFKPGQSGHPGGRPVGSRNAINAAFLKALSKEFDRSGEQAIKRVAEEDPATFMRILAALQPKEVQHTRALDEISDEQLEAAAIAVKAVLAAKENSTKEVMTEALTAAKEKPKFSSAWPRYSLPDK